MSEENALVARGNYKRYENNAEKRAAGKKYPDNIVISVDGSSAELKIAVWPKQDATMPLLPNFEEGFLYEIPVSWRKSIDGKYNNASYAPAQGEIRKIPFQPASEADEDLALITEIERKHGEVAALIARAKLNAQVNIIRKAEESKKC